ncbi:MAG: hypothetical protein IJ733_06655 [Lachnospiraceae bacterium]|nr:hypothetical protein [Lachnospiraceae bacterium]
MPFLTVGKTDKKHKNELEKRTKKYKNGLEKRTKFVRIYEICAVEGADAEFAECGSYYGEIWIVRKKSEC